MMRLLLVCVAGALGTGLRFLIGLWAVRRFGQSFPVGTLIVNVLGCFAIAAILAFAERSRAVPQLAVTTLTTGFLGGFTTYSSFNEETLRFLRANDTRWAFLYLMGTVVLCALAGMAGHFVAARSRV